MKGNLMNDKFTPGPWHTCGNGQCKCKQIWSNEHPVAQITSGKWGDDYPSLKVSGPSLQLKVEAVMEQITYGEVDEETAVANARLIAAAPDLLAALRLCLPIMEAHTEASHLTDGFRPRINKNDHILAQVKKAIKREERRDEDEI